MNSNATPTAAQIIAALANPAVVFTFDDIQRGYAALRQRESRLSQVAATSFAPGDEVSFKSRATIDHPTGIYTGTVVKINKKSVSVRVGRVQWNVHPSLLSRAENK